MPVITCIDDLKRLHRRRTPKMFYDYCESGSWTEQTFRENTSDFQQIRLKQRVAVDMTNRTLESEMIGQKVAMPVALAPVGLTGMQRADGEIKAAKAAEKFGVPFTLSTMSICSIEDVADHTTKPFWFQLYTMKDQDYLRRLIERAKAAGCSALVITLDLQILGQRHKDLKNGLSAPPKLTPTVLADLATKWTWGLEMLGTKRRSFGNIVGHAKGVDDPSSLFSWTAEQFDPRLDWKKIEEIKEMWGGKVILKGVLDPEDAKMAAKVGCDAILVSNHGGRQLDGALSSIRMLDPILDAVGDDVEVHLDSGIRSGQDVLKAVSMGAKGTFIGRAFVHGLGAMGEAGVTRALEVIAREMDISMALCG
uniref:alpha-hydroxy acid oxidase n=1 Tax=Oceanicola sp. S124 TaxID=1042378 RepID=UPI00025584E7